MSDSKDIVQRAVALLEREGFIKEAEAIEALEAEVINHRSIMDHAVKRAEAAEAEVERLKHIAEHRHPTMDDLLNERLKTKAAEAQASRMRDALEKIVQGDYPRSGRNFYDATTRTPSKHDTCGHGKAYWDDCGNCCSSFARKALDEQ